MIQNQKLLVTGVTGKIAFPPARELAKYNDVWGAARFRKRGDLELLIAADSGPLRLDMSDPDFSSLPNDFNSVFHAASLHGPENGEAANA